LWYGHVEAISFLRQKRGIINPNPGFIKQLQQFQKRLDGPTKTLRNFVVVEEDQFLNLENENTSQKKKLNKQWRV
jgi:hypothetical protein